MPGRTGTSWSRITLLVSGFLFGAFVTGLGVFLTRQGLERADKFASVIGMFIGLAGLVVAIYSAWLARSAASTVGRAAPADGADSTGKYVQNVKAEASGSTAQGAMFGNINNYGRAPGSPASETGPHDDHREAEDDRR